MAPTRELAMQIELEAEKLSNRSALRAVTVYGGADQRKQIRELAVGADIVELHVGRYCEDEAGRADELARIQQAAALTESLGIECHAGHGLDYDTVADIAAIPQMRELNIGHFLMGESLFVGMPAAIAEMRRLMVEARGE